jgi:threonylcarbamoyladenosine tRNA methylthiotransferase MtaB
MRAAFFTLGCKLNQSESEALASSFGSRGFFIVPHTEEADIYIFNTCTVTSMAEQKARRMIRKVAREHPRSLVIITGCYAQLEPEEAEGLAENVLVLGQQRKHHLLELPAVLEDLAVRGGARSGEVIATEEGGTGKGVLSAHEVMARIEELERGKAEPPYGPFSFAAETYSFHSRAFLKVQDGCDRRCGYCRVPLARGDSVSLEARSVLERARRLEASGYREIVITGVNITSYRDGSDRLPELIDRLTGELELARIRLSSIEPEMITERLLEAVSHPSVCAHFHLPVQSGSDEILAAVGRPYRADRVRRAAAQLRSVKNDPFIAADVIVGLPGEGDDEFEQTRSLLKDCSFSRLHVFPYSPRPGTALYTQKGPRVPERIAGERARSLQRLSEELYETYTRRQVGTVTEAVLEQEESAGMWSGLSDSYLHLSIAGVPRVPARRGSLCRVHIVDPGAREEGRDPGARFQSFA